MRGKGERKDDSLFSDDTQIFALDNSVVPFATMGMEKRMRTLFRPVHCGMTVGHLFSELICYLHIFVGGISVQIFCPFSNIFLLRC